MKPKHTKNQRKRLFLLARVLDKVPRNQFEMEDWFSEFDQSEGIRAIREHRCGTTACAIGHALCYPSIAGQYRAPRPLIQGLGFDTADFGGEEIADSGAANRLFGPHRSCGPRKVANDIRRYLKDGTLPTR